MGTVAANAPYIGLLGTVLGRMLPQHKRYSAVARRLQQQASEPCWRRFSAQDDLLNCHVLASSGFDSLDDAAVQLVRHRQQQIIPIRIKSDNFPASLYSNSKSLMI